MYVEKFTFRRLRLRDLTRKLINYLNDEVLDVEFYFAFYFLFIYI
jgi:hypothetical protein